MDKRLLADTRPLANPHFRRLWRANIVTVIGAQLTVVAVPAQIYGMTGSSAYVGLTGVFGLLPLVVFHVRNPGALTRRFEFITYIRPESGWAEVAWGFVKHYLGNFNL